MLGIRSECDASIEIYGEKLSEKEIKVDSKKGRTFETRSNVWKRRNGNQLIKVFCVISHGTTTTTSNTNG
jgi:hypothetical protein